MKTQIKFKNSILLILSLVITTFVWSNGSNAEEADINAETNKTVLLWDQLVENMIIEEATDLNNLFHFMAAGETYITNYPEPLEFTTHIDYEVEETTNVTIVVQRGPEVIIKLVEGFHKAGKYTLKWDASHLPPGKYEAVMVTDFGTFTKSMLK